MNIDIYIQLLKDHCNNLDYEEMDGIAKWLEELKIYKESNISIKNYQQVRGKCVYPDCFNCGLPDCTRSDFSTVVEKETFNIKTRYERK